MSHISNVFFILFFIFWSKFALNYKLQKSLESLCPFLLQNVVSFMNESDLIKIDNWSF